MRSTPVGIRTPNLLIRSQMLYPIELQARFPFQEPQGVAVRLVYQKYRQSQAFFCIFLQKKEKSLQNQPKRPSKSP